MTLVLDNYEHILDAVAELPEEALEEGSQLAVPATSREPLMVDGEHVVAQVSAVELERVAQLAALHDDARAADKECSPATCVGTDGDTVRSAGPEYPT